VSNISKTFNFLSGVAVDTSSGKIIATAKNYSNTIHSENIDNLKYVKILRHRMSFLGLLSRTFFIGLLLMIFNEVLTNHNEYFSNKIIVLGMIIIGLSVLGFFLLMIDSFAELGITNSIMNSFFSDECYLVTIGNKSGNNIEFYALIVDLKLIKELEQKVNNLREENKLKGKINVPSNDKIGYLENLKKLGDLFHNGILTQEEFEKKKNELLNTK
jgi:membrane-associated HD superfamily phosphohydrolase